MTFSVSTSAEADSLRAELLKEADETLAHLQEGGLQEADNR